MDSAKPLMDKELLLPTERETTPSSGPPSSGKPKLPSLRLLVACTLGLGVFLLSYYVWLTDEPERFKQSITVLNIYGAMMAMACFNVASDLAMFTTSVVLLVFQVITKDDFLSGYGNSSVVTVGLLLVVAKGVEETGALEWLVKALLGKPKSRVAAQIVMMIPVLLISAFLSNTACVAMMIPIIQSWSDGIGVSRSQLLLPLSYVSMMGGCLSLIGSSNNLVAYEKAKDYYADNPELGGITIGMFDVALAGVPMTLCGIAYMVLTSKYLLPDDMEGTGAEPRGSVSAQPGGAPSSWYSMCFWVGKNKKGRPNDVFGLTPEQVAFDRPGLALHRRHRQAGESGEDSRAHTPFREGELLIFKGTAGRLAQLQRVPGLALATKEIEKLSFAKLKYKSDNRLSKRRHRRIIEAVVAMNSPLIGKRVKDASFRQSYNAVIIARRQGLGRGRTNTRLGEEESSSARTYSRGNAGAGAAKLGEDLEMSCGGGGCELNEYVCLDTKDVGNCECNTSWGEVVFSPGDSLLMVASSGFAKQHATSRLFALVTELADSKPRRDDNWKDMARMVVTWLMLFAIIGVSAWKDDLLLEMCVITITIQIFFQMMTLDEAWSAVKGSTLLTIASSFSLGTAITECGLSDILANGINAIAAPFGKIGLIAVVYFFTSFLSILVSNTAVVVFLFNPVATAASDAGMDLLPFVFVLMIASSAAYATPISYQTNLMVFGPGGYQFNDYLKFGGPLQIVSWVSTTIAVYAIWGEKKTLD